MSLHDRLAMQAAVTGKTAAQFSGAAQKHANATWFYFIVAGVVWYFADGGWALIPAAIGLYTV